MKLLIFMTTTLTLMTSLTIFDFNHNSDLKHWIVVDDVVMGGKSSGSFGISPQGYGVFEGSISLENNGGFSSVRYKMERILVKDFTKIAFKIKGDGKKYQLRIKCNSTDYYSYISTFSTSGDWQEVEIPLKEMYPSFRGRRVNKANFAKDYIEEVAFLIGNKSEETFKLLVDKIELR